MYMLFRGEPAKRVGQALDPNIHYIRRTYKDLITSVRTYYNRNTKYVGSNNLFALIIQQFVMNFSLDDNDWIHQIENYSPGVARNLGLVSSINKGKVFVGGVTLGPHSEEVVIATYENFDKSNLSKRWRDLKPVRYLYHTRLDTSLPIMNNTTPGKAFGVISINIPMLMTQYRYWIRWQMRMGVEQFENSYRFVGSILLPSMIESFLDIAFFNRMDRQSQDIKNPDFPVSHPFYLTDMNPRLQKLAERINIESILKGVDIESLAWITPMIVGSNLTSIMALPKEPVTYHNEWALSLARLAYIRYLARMVLRNQGFDRHYMNVVMIDLIEGSNEGIFNGVQKTEFINNFRKQIVELIKELKK